MIATIIAVIIIVTILAIKEAAGAAVEKGSNGEVRVYDPKIVWKKTDVAVDSAVLLYHDLWKEAYRYPDVVVPITTHDIYERDGLFHEKVSTVAEAGIVRNGNEIHVVNDRTIVSRVRFNPFLVLWLLSIAAASTATWLRIKTLRDVRMAIFLAAVMALVTAIAAFFSFSLSEFFILGGSAVIVAFSAQTKKIGPFFIWVSGYTLGMIVSVVLFLCG